ncbi:MAG: class I SAM-dependent methyltransferase [Bacilli bacterium]|nr:class I SAM-dependent methyltransferase [Bacilli bacterium]
MPENQIEKYFSSIAPNWDAMEDIPPERIEKLLDKLTIREGEHILDVACGTGIITGRLADRSKAKVLGVDICGRMVEIARRKYEGNPRVEFMVADFVASDFKEEYDLVVIYNAFPHFMDVKALEGALSRALRKGGRFAILHSMSREALDDHHEFLPEGVSRCLESAEIEARPFTDCFHILESSESENHFCIIGKKI